MDTFLPYLLSLLLLVPLIFFLRRKVSNHPKNLPPGSVGWPVLGESLEFWRLGFQRLVRERMQKHSDQAFKTSLFREKMAVLCGAKGNKFIFSNETKLFRPWFPLSVRKVIFQETDSRRSLETEAHFRNFQYDTLKPEALKSYLPAMDALAREHMDEGGWRQKTVVKILIVRGLYIITRKKMMMQNTEGGDMLSKMVMATDEDGMIGNVLLALIVSTQYQVSSGVAIVVDYLARLPHIYNQVFQEQMDIAKSKGPNEVLTWEHIEKMKYTWNVVRECFRLTPPALGSFREATSEISFAGFTIPKGWKVMWTAHSCHMNPDYFPKPEMFDPSRFEGSGPAPYTFVPFGAGSRMCPGIGYVRLATLVFIHNLVTRFKFEKAIPNEKMLFHRNSPTPAHGLPLNLHPR